MTGRAAIAAIVATFVLGAAEARAQVTVGDSLWRLGRVEEASAAYRKAIEEDRNSVRANYRIAQTLAWRNNIDSALVLLRAARERVPDDPDLLFTEATYLSWAKRYDQAIVRFDTLIAAHPGNDFAYVRVAKARTLSWAGDLAGAERGYRDVLSRDSTDRDARFGLALSLAQDANANAFFDHMAQLVLTDARLASDILERKECQSKAADPRFAPLVQDAKTQAMD